MQGNWCINVESKNTIHPQQFLISGATSGSGIYNVSLNAPPVMVSGNQWVLSIQSDLGNGFVQSHEQIRYPYKVGGKYHFTIEASTTKHSEGLNDLTLSLCTPQTTTDFLIYGNVSTYDDPCFFNPYHHFWIVLETRHAFFEALKYDALRLAIKQLYLDRLAEEVLVPFTERTKEQFTPLIIPLHDDTIIPPSLGQVLKINRKPAKISEDKSQADNYSITPEEIFTLSQPKKLEIELNRMSLVNLFDQVLPRSITESLSNIELHFFEYIRTATEFNGGPYSGEGKRKRLGSCISDQFGNYIFRFCKSKIAYLDNSIFKTRLAKDTAFQFMPDILIQLHHKTTNNLIHESIPFWNVPLLKRINISFPKKKLTSMVDFVIPERKKDISRTNTDILPT